VKIDDISLTYKDLDTYRKGSNIILSNNNHIVNLSKGGDQSILCIDSIPLEGTYTFTATHSSTGTKGALIGIAKRNINLEGNLA